MSRSNVTPFRAPQRTQKGRVSTSDFREQIVGKRIEAVVAKPGRDGQPPTVLMMQFDDGSVVEWVSPRSDAVLRRALCHGRRTDLKSSPNHEFETLPLPLIEAVESRQI